MVCTLSFSKKLGEMEYVKLMSQSIPPIKITFLSFLIPWCKCNIILRPNVFIQTVHSSEQLCLKFVCTRNVFHRMQRIHDAMLGFSKLVCVFLTGWRSSEKLHSSSEVGRSISRPCWYTAAPETVKRALCYALMSRFFYYVRK